MHRTLFESLEPGKPPLRIGILLDSCLLPRLFAEITSQIVACDFAKIELLIFNSGPDEPGREPPPKRSKLRLLYDSVADPALRKKFLYNAYQRWDRRNSQPGIEPTEDVDCSDLLKAFESIQVKPITRKFEHRFPPEAIAKIRAKELDVLIRFGFNILRGDILSSSKYGLWSYHHGDNDYYRGGPAHFWEVYEKNPISGVILQVLTEELDAGHVLAKGYFATMPGLSVTNNRVAPYWGSLTFMLQKLRQLHGRGWELLERESWPRQPYLGRKKIYRTPSNKEMATWLVPEVARKVINRIGRKETQAYWRLAIRTGAQPLEDSKSSDGFEWLQCPRGHFYADPFLLEHAGSLWVFFEDFVYADNLGKIACAELKDGKLGEATRILDPAFHLSFPCVFRDGDSIYMIPESATQGEVTLYRATEFPYQWEQARVLYKGAAVDTSVWQKDGLWYFFTGLWEPRGEAVQFWLFCADSPDGEWRPHPASPISTDVRLSRNGGAIFERNGRLFRPSQDCSGAYGRCFSLNEIVKLSPTEYEERPCVTVEPTWAGGLAGTHSYAQCGDVEIIDGCQFRPVDELF